MWYNGAKGGIMVRDIIRPEDTKMTIDIPPHYVGRRIEYIVFPLDSEERPVRRKRSLKGALKAYADPAKRKLEATAWQEHIQKTYET